MPDIPLQDDFNRSSGFGVPSKWKLPAALVGIPMPAEPMEHTWFCPGYCGWQVRVDPPMSNSGANAAWLHLVYHVHECARGHAVFTMLKRAASWSLDHLLDDEPKWSGHENHGELRKLLRELDHDQAVLEIVHRMYTGRK